MIGKVYRKAKYTYSTLSTSINKSINKKNIKKLHNLFEGKRCFIMGNGPSLNQMDLSIFENEIVFASNRCYLLYDQINWRPKFYASVDARVVPDISDELNDLIIRENNTTYFFYTGHKAYINDSKNVNWFDMKPWDYENLPYGTFSLQPTEFLYNVATVTITLLQLAVYMGFNSIYLFGCDTNYVIPDSVVKDGQNGLISTQNDDLNHFSSNYFGTGAKWHDPHVDRMIFHYEQAKLVCNELGVNVFNATVGGKLEVFPRVDYLKLF